MPLDQIPPSDPTPTHGQIRHGGSRNALNAAALRKQGQHAAAEHDAAHDRLLSARRQVATAITAAHELAARKLSENLHEVAVLSEHGGVCLFDRNGDLVDRIDAPGARAFTADRSERRVLFWSRPEGELATRSRTPAASESVRGRSTELTITNDLPVAVLVIRLDQRGRDADRTMVAVRQTRRVPTYVGYAYRVVDATFGEELLVHRISANATEDTLVIPPQVEAARRCELTLENPRSLPVAVTHVPGGGATPQTSSVALRSSAPIRGNEGDVVIVRDGDIGELMDVRTLRPGLREWVVPPEPTRSVTRSRTPVKLRVRNRTGFDLEAFWVDESGREKKFWTMWTGLTSIALVTYPGHLWRFKSRNGFVFRTYQVTTNADVILTVDFSDDVTAGPPQLRLHGYLGEAKTWFTESGFTTTPVALAADAVAERLFAMDGGGGLQRVDYRGESFAALTQVNRPSASENFRLTFDPQTRILFAASRARILSFSPPYTSHRLLTDELRGDEPALLAPDGVNRILYYSPDRRSIVSETYTSVGPRRTLHETSKRIGGLAFDGATRFLYWIEGDEEFWCLKLGRQQNPELLFRLPFSGPCHDLTLLTEVGVAQQAVLAAQQRRMEAAQQGEEEILSAIAIARAEVAAAYEELGTAEARAEQIVTAAAKDGRAQRAASRTRMLDLLAAAAGREAAARQARRASRREAFEVADESRRQSHRQAAAILSEAHADLAAAHRNLHQASESPESNSPMA